ncbi:MAG: bifunctional UDP-sugar hydrolase/5'-nucleotidase [Acidobacteriota bacterium]
MRIRQSAISVLLALSLAAPALAADGHFKILQINDVYKIEGLENGTVGGLARVRTIRKQLESDGTPVLLMHAGDALFPSVMSKYLAAQPILRVMNVLDGDAAAFDPNMFVTLGNHELENPDAIYTLGRLAQSDFRWVTSNVFYCHGGNCEETFAKRVPTMHDTLVINAGGVRVGIFGLTTDSGKADYFRIDFNDEKSRFAAARKAIDSLKKRGARVIIGLTHEDFDDDVVLAQQFPEITLIVGGHDHLYGRRKVGSTLITKADADAKSVIVWDVRVPAKGKPIVTADRMMVDTTVANDPMVANEVAMWQAALVKKLGPNDTIGQTTNLLEGLEPAVRGRETALGNFLADVARDFMQADIGLMNGGGIRINDNIPPGPVRKYDMEGIFYYANLLVDFNLTGAQLLDILRSSVARVDVGDGRFLQVSGIRFKYRAGGVINPEDVQVQRRGESDFRPLDLAGTYHVGTIQYIYDRGSEDGYPLFDPKNPDRPKLLRNRTAPDYAAKYDYRAATEQTIRALPDKTITTAIEGRIVRVE